MGPLSRRALEDMNDFPPVTDREVEPCVRIFFNIEQDDKYYRAAIFGIDGLGSYANVAKHVYGKSKTEEGAIESLKRDIRHYYAPNAKFYKVDLEEF
jgi:hypothetical protein